MTRKQFKISVVIPVYNVELYVAETIESVIRQDIGFEENVQIVLVNDGSPDGSGQICEEYAKRYPENIQYVYQENAGVSVARNTGMDYIKGKYVNFLDSDDKWSTDAFSKVYDFFEAHEKEINLVCCKQELFEAKTGPHRLSRGDKFAASRVINILDDYQYIQFHITASFIKSDAMRLTLFDPKMKYGEDAVYVIEQILDKHKYGVVSEPTHYYRKRADNSSAVQTKEKALDWYKITPQRFYKKLIDISIQKWGYTIPFVQYAVCYDMQWRLNDRIHMVLDENEQEIYIREIRNLLEYCEDDIIIKQRDINLKKKLFLLSLKYNEDISNQVVCRNSKLYFHNMQIFDLQKNALFRADVVKVENGMLCMSGKIDFNFTGELNLFFIDDKGIKYPVKLLKLEGDDGKIWNREVTQVYYYDIRIDISKIKWLEIRAFFRKEFLFRPKIVCGKFSKFYNNDMKSYYYVQNHYLLTKDLHRVYIKACNKKLEKKLEQNFREELNHLEVDDAVKNEVLWYRKKYFMTRAIHFRKIWLVSEYISADEEHREEFLQQLVKIRPSKAELYFVVSDESKDYGQIKKIGKVIPFDSKKCKLYTLLADKIISSKEDDHIVNPFEDLKPYVENLFHYDYMYLQWENGELGKNGI